MTKAKAKTVKVKGVGVLSTWYKGLVCVQTYGKGGRCSSRGSAEYYSRQEMQVMGNDDVVVDCEITFTIPTKGRKRS